MLSRQPFLALTKSANSPKAAADLITHATSAQGTYIFTELLASPSIRGLASSPEYQPYLTQLQIFSNGLYSTYASTPNLPELNDRQKLKLRQLSLLTLSRDKENLTYPALQQHLGLASPREVEDLVISAVYAGLLNAKLNPLRSVVQVASVAPLRDVQPATVPSIVATLQNWSQRCDATLAEIEANIATIKKEAARKANDKREWDRTFQAVVTAETNEPTDLTGSGITANGGRGAGRRLGGGAAGRTGLRAGSGGGAGAGGGGGGSQAAAGGAGSGSKRGTDKLTEGLEDDDDEAMDLDDNADAAGQNQKRTSRRKL
ncbi:cop9 signalosome complex subunit 7a [Diaporthe amygdali]|uniref:cop9 signalosome complex subunit 7a n=1 Tax=Phomopsis amygdali TaxID=1214568 RepID=UPI0022FE2F69|nr:cop9 signalosome complex subunit 7a [Diaporthe amygdali]KAJ0104164.1 cop9 signalosome complex subunit 7a [Diaporthe amygdali]